MAFRRVYFLRCHNYLSVQAPLNGYYSNLYRIAEQENARDPLAEEVRSILDGHIILSRKLAEESHYPAIDILRSISRIMPQVTSEAQQNTVAGVRKLMARYLEIELLLRVGEYERGLDSEADAAIDKRDAINAFYANVIQNK